MHTYSYGPRTGGDWCTNSTTAAVVLCTTVLQASTIWWHNNSVTAVLIGDPEILSPQMFSIKNNHGFYEAWIKINGAVLHHFRILAEWKTLRRASTFWRFGSGFALPPRNASITRRVLCGAVGTSTEYNTYSGVYSKCKVSAADIARSMKRVRDKCRSGHQPEN